MRKAVTASAEEAASHHQTPTKVAEHKNVTHVKEAEPIAKAQASLQNLHISQPAAEAI